MIKPPSVQNDYSLVWSGDPALELPDDPAERQRVLTIARETGRWSDITRAGESPTVFQLRKLPKDAFDYVIGEQAESTEFGGRRLTQVETCNLFLRVALRSIENWDGGPKVKAARVSKGSEITAATRETLNAIGAVVDHESNPVGAWIVGELGLLVFAKETSGISPK